MEVELLEGVGKRKSKREREREKVGLRIEGGRISPKLSSETLAELLRQRASISKGLHGDLFPERQGETQLLLVSENISLSTSVARRPNVL